MTKRSAIFCLCAISILFGTASAALAGGQLPGPLADEFTLFPGSKIMRAQSNPNGSHVAQVNFGKTAIPEVFTYYKTKLAENGFTIQQTLQGQSIIAAKKNMDAVISLQTQRGETVGMLALDVKQPRPAAPAPPAPPAAPKPKESDGKMDMGGLVGGKTKYPAELAAIVGPYPGSMIMYSRQKGRGIAVMLTAKGVPAEDVVSFYKAEISKKGWQKAFDENNGGNTVLGFTKAGKEVTVVVRNAGEAAIVTLDLKQ